MIDPRTDSAIADSLMALGKGCDPSIRPLELGGVKSESVATGLTNSEGADLLLRLERSEPKELSVKDAPRFNVVGTELEFTVQLTFDY